MLRRAAIGAAVPVLGYFGYENSPPGLKRTLQFWATVGPPFIEYQVLKRVTAEDKLDAAIVAFHERTAPRMLGIILDLGGIYVKLGQMISTLGVGLFNDVYMQALAPLQDGVPPRELSAVKAIIEESVKLPFAEVFSSFEPVPVGAASIAQAHRATLRDGTEVIVKVQYPEVSAHYAADFDNLEVLAGFLFPETLPMVAGLRKRHEGELDFRQEAANLRECRANAEKRFKGKVVLPAVPAPHLVTQHVLAMECLPGKSLAAAIENEQSEMAAALGLSGGAQELRKRTLKMLKTSFRNDKENGAKGAVDPTSSAKNTATVKIDPEVAIDAGLPPPPEDRWSDSGNGKMFGALSDRLMGLAPEFAAWAAAGLRTYASTRRSILDLQARLTAVLHRLFASLFSMGSLSSAAANASSNEEDDKSSGPQQGDSRGSSNAHMLSKGADGSARVNARVDVGRCLEMLVQAHGAQLLLDGCHNADPHPGNVLVLPDGRLGLIDYGMVGRLPLGDRLQVAKVVVALAEKNVEEVARLYAAAGYRAVTTLGGKPHPPEVVHRIATFHLNRIDLSVVNVTPPLAALPPATSDNNDSSAEEEDKQPQAPEYKSIMRVLHGTVETSVPDWVEQSRRLGGLLIGVSNQAGRPMSLANAWAPLARQLLKEHANDADAIIAERHREVAAAKGEQMLP